MRFRAYPEAELSQILAQWIGCQRVIYNGKVEEDCLFRSQRRLLLTSNPLADAAELKTPLDRQYSHFKDAVQTPWLSDVPSQILRNGCDRWWEGKQRQLKGLAKAPRRRKRHNFNSVVISSVLFRFVEWTKLDGHGRTVVCTSLELGTYSDPVGILNFHAHCAFDIPKQIILRRTGDRSSEKWWLSFSYAHEPVTGFVPRTESELAFELDLLDDETLETTSIGLDRNVKDNCVATSDGRFYGLSLVQQERLARKEKGAKRLQRRFARCKKGSRNSIKMRGRISAKHEYRGNVARDFSHQTSHVLVSTGANGTNAAPKLITMENLKVAIMTLAPKAKQDPVTGKWLKNGVAQKAGLNRAILASCWGRIDTQLHYKGFRKNTLVLKTPAAYSSQECCQCGHTHPDNRHEQRFVCQRCGFVTHADTNAACVTAGRGVAKVRAHQVCVKAKKSVSFRKKKGTKDQGTKTGRESSSVPVEGRVRRDKVVLCTAELLQHPLKPEDLTVKSDAPTTARSV